MQLNCFVFCNKLFFMVFGNRFFCLVPGSGFFMVFGNMLMVPGLMVGSFVVLGSGLFLVGRGRRRMFAMAWGMVFSSMPCMLLCI